MATDEDGEGPVFVVYSSKNTGRIKAALKAGNYKKVGRIIKHSMKNAWVNEAGTPNTYEARQMRAAGVNAPLNVSARAADSKTGYTFIYGYEKDGEGYKRVKLFQIADIKQSKSLWERFKKADKDLGDRIKNQPSHKVNLPVTSDPARKDGWLEGTDGVNYGDNQSINTDLDYEEKPSDVDIVQLPGDKVAFLKKGTTDTNSITTRGRGGETNTTVTYKGNEPIK
jgi:hypothetical protein